MATIKDSANWASHQAYPSDKSMTWDQMELQSQLRLAFQKGARWQKNQMLKDAVEGYVNYYEDSGGVLMAEAQVGCPYHNGDKVRIVIVKEDQK